MSYLHPSQRPLKAGQIGPSSHKNEYHVGVLHGNWAEDRRAFGRGIDPSVKFASKTETQTSFRPRTDEEYHAAIPPQVMAPENPRALLFGHDVCKAEQGTFQGTATNPDRRTRLMAKKMEEWEASDNPKAHFLTLKNVTYDATGEYIKDNKIFTPSVTQKGPGVAVDTTTA